MARKTPSSGSKRTTKASKASKASKLSRTVSTAKKKGSKAGGKKTATTSAKQAPRKKVTKKQSASGGAARAAGGKSAGAKTVARPATSKAAVRKQPVRPTTAAASVQPAGGDHSREQQALQAVLAGQRLSEAQLRKAKSGLSRKQLADYRRLLLDKRSQLLGDVASLQNDVNEKAGNLSNMPLHMADVGSDHYEQEFSLGLMESDRKVLREIDQAIMRIGSGTYGVCMITGLPIGTARLDAKPWARYCIEVVREREKRGLYE